MALTHDTEDYDTDAYHDVSTNTARLTAPATGKYRIAGTVAFTANATGTRTALIRKNGSTNIALTQVPGSSASLAAIPVGCTVDLTAGDYVELCALQNSGSTLNSLTNAEYSPLFEIERRE